MDDLIRRADAIDALERTEWYHQAPNGTMVHGANSAEHQAWYKEQDAFKALEIVPTAQRWIPCKEALPDANIPVLVTTVGMRERRYTAVDWIDPYTGEWDRSTNVSAWMPMPEPWREDGDNG